MVKWVIFFQTLEGYSHAVLSVACSSDRKYIVRGSDDKIFRIWGVE